MSGPEPKPDRIAPGGSDTFQRFISGARHEVVRAFTDYDGALHPIGEAWWFPRHAFLPHEDGLSLFVSPDGEGEQHIRLQWRSEARGAIIDALADYVRPARHAR